MSKENYASRVSVRERGRPSFLVLLNARDPTPGHSYLRLWRKCLLPSAPRVRLRTLNRTSYESRNAMTNVPTAARAASALRNFSIWGPPDRVVGRPRTGCVARVFYCERMRLLPASATFANICSIVIRPILRAAAPWLLCPKNGADSNAESAPKREWQSKNVDGQEKCPQVSWPSHPTCQRDG